jgi:uncharacterized protein DUF7009
VKLRIKGDSLRLRLTRAEVQQLAQAGRVEEQVHISARDVLVYRLQRAPAAAVLGATFANGVIEIQVPESVARDWCASELVTLSNVQRHGEVELRITVEKDFACLAPRDDEDESDNFQHPKERSPRA